MTSIRICRPSRIPPAPPSHTDQAKNRIENSSGQASGQFRTYRATICSVSVSAITRNDKAVRTSRVVSSRVQARLTEKRILVNFSDRFELPLYPIHEAFVPEFAVELGPNRLPSRRVGKECRSRWS